MQRLLLCVVASSVVGCKAKSEVGAGSGSTHGTVRGDSAVTPPLDAVTADASVATLALDAAAAAGPPPADKLISEKGVGPITADTPRATISTLFPGATIQREQQETEDQNYEWISIVKNKKLSLKILVDNMVNDKSPTRVLVHDPSFATAEGIHVGSTGAELAAAYKSATCKATKWDEEPLPQLYCEVKGAARLVFYFETKGTRLAVGAHPLAVIAPFAIDEIMWSTAMLVEEDEED